MTSQTDPPLRRWPGRGAVLVGATLVLSLSAGPGAHADDGGLLGGATQVVEEATQPVVQTAVDAVQPAIPQPVQEAVAPVVEHVVEPAASHAEQAVKAVPGADPAAHPVGEVVEPGVRPAEEPVEESVEAPAAQNVHPVVGSAPAPAASQAPVPGGPTSGHAVDGPGDGTSVADPCASVTDLPPRGMAVSDIVRHPGRGDVLSAHQALWNLANALMHMWLDENARRSVDVGPPEDGLGDVRAFDVPKGGTTDVPEPGTSSAERLIELIGLIGLLGLLAAGLTLGLARQLERPA